MPISVDVQQFVDAIRRIGMSGMQGTSTRLAQQTYGAQLMKLLEDKIAGGSASDDERIMYEDIRSARGANKYLGALEWVVPTIMVAGNIATGGAKAGSVSGGSGGAGGGVGWQTGAEEAARIGTSSIGGAGGIGGVAGFLKSKLGSSLLSGGMSLFSDVPAKKREVKRQRQDISKREQAALGELSPEAMQGLIQMFMSKYMSILSPRMQSAQQGLAANAGRTGMNRSGLTQQLAAGIPGQFSLEALRQAIGSAMPVASQRAGIVAGRPIPTMPSGLRGIGDFTSMVSKYFLGKDIRSSSLPYG